MNKCSRTYFLQCWSELTSYYVRLYQENQIIHKDLLGIPHRLTKQTKMPLLSEKRTTCMRNIWKLRSSSSQQLCCYIVYHFHPLYYNFNTKYQLTKCIIVKKLSALGVLLFRIFISIRRSLWANVRLLGWGG